MLAISTAEQEKVAKVPSDIFHFIGAATANTVPSPPTYITQAAPAGSVPAVPSPPPSPPASCGTTQWVSLIQEGLDVVEVCLSKCITSKAYKEAWYAYLWPISFLPWMWFWCTSILVWHCSALWSIKPYNQLKPLALLQATMPHLHQGHAVLPERGHPDTFPGKRAYCLLQLPRFDCWPWKSHFWRHVSRGNWRSLGGAVFISALGLKTVTNRPQNKLTADRSKTE